MGDTIRPYIGIRVLEIGSGIGNLTEQFMPRAVYLASDVNPNYVRYLRGYAVGKPYLRVRTIDVTVPSISRDSTGSSTPSSC